MRTIKMTEAKENKLSDTPSENDNDSENSIILELDEFDLSDLDSIKGTALGNILEKNFSSAPTAHTKHTSHSSHSKYSSSAW